MRVPSLAVGVIDDSSPPCTPVQGLSASCGDLSGGTAVSECNSLYAEATTAITPKALKVRSADDPS